MQQKRIIARTILLLSLGFTALQAQTVKDIDGNVYKTVNIGTQTWMAENLKTTKFNDGSKIPLVSDYTSWGTLTTPAYCWYDNNPANSKNKYGALYNWYTVNTGKLCPAGWHVPTDAEWTMLTNQFGTDDIAGGKLKETDTTHWQAPNGSAANEGGFSAIPGGIRGSNGAFGDQGYFGYWWTSTGSVSTEAWYRYIGFNEGWVQRLSFGKKQSGFSVRCVFGPAATTKAPAAVEQNPQGSVTIRNEQYRYEVTIPSGWAVSKGIKTDPDEGMMKGSPGFAIESGVSQGEPKGWNGLAVNTPFIAIYAHEKPGQKPEDFSKLLQNSLAGFQVKPENMNLKFSVAEANGFDCNYTLGLKSRFVALYRNGIRVIVYTIQFPQNDTTLYEKNAKEIDNVIKSIRIK